MSRIYSVPGIFGGEDFYDEHGQPEGYSAESVLGGNDYYDASGKRAGWSAGKILGGETIHLDRAPGREPPDDPDGFNPFGDSPEDPPDW